MFYYSGKDQTKNYLLNEVRKLETKNVSLLAMLGVLKNVKSKLEGKKITKRFETILEEEINKLQPPKIAYKYALHYYKKDFISWSEYSISIILLNDKGYSISNDYCDNIILLSENGYFQYEKTIEALNKKIDYNCKQAEKMQQEADNIEELYKQYNNIVDQLEAFKKNQSYLLNDITNIPYLRKL